MKVFDRRNVMGLLLTLAATLAGSGAEAFHGLAGNGSTGIEFHDGRWWDGTAFVSGPRYAVDQRLTSTAPDIVLETVDLAGGFAIPPFGEAHTHRPDGWPGTEAHVEAFLRHGIYYVMNQNSFPSLTAEVAGQLNVPWSVDVLFANGGLTAAGSHVVELYEGNLERGVFPEGWSQERLDGEGFFVIENRGDLDTKWSRVIGGRPDFVKVFMGFSEEYARRRADPAFEGKRGIDPALVPEIVERAHDAGLRVSAHIETAEDFRIAVSADVDMIAHLPGSWRVGADAGYVDDTVDRWLLDEADAARAGARGVVVVAHAYNARRNDAIAEIHRHNLRLLKDAGVHLAIGSDNYRQTSLREAIVLQESGLFTAAEMLQLAGESTVRAIYPERRIGRLAEGYEASFLVVEGDPVARPLFEVAGDDLDEQLGGVVQRIKLRVKQGFILN